VLLPSFTPRLTNVKGVDNSTSSGQYEVLPGGFVAFELQINAKNEIESADSAGFGVTLPVPARANTRHLFTVHVEGRQADNGNWSGVALTFGTPGTGNIDRVRLPGLTNGGSLQNITSFYGGAEGEILTISGVYKSA
jgi:hypothetical protein